MKPTVCEASTAQTAASCVMASLGTCDRHPSALAKYAVVSGLLELNLCGHCRIVHASALYDQGWSVIDADECDTTRRNVPAETIEGGCG